MRFVLLIIIISFGCLDRVAAQQFDISAGGPPTITGGKNASVTGSSSVTTNLVVTVDFGELSPSNINPYVKLTVPIAVRSRNPYQVTVALTGSTGTSPNAVQATDVGLGIRNMRAMGAQSRVCSNNIIHAPFSNDPSASVTVNAAGRAQYVADLGDVLTGPVILSGPRLSNTNSGRATNDGWIFDAVVVITPQFFTGGFSNGILTFTISAGPNVNCT